MKYAIFAIGVLMMAPMVNLTAANSSPNLPSVWSVSGGGQGPQGEMKDALEAVRLGRWSQRPEISELAEDVLYDILDELAETRGVQRKGQQ